MVKEISLVQMFEQFIRDTRTGIRRKLNGERIGKATILNYSYALKSIMNFEKHTGQAVRLKLNIRNNQKVILQERNYWKRFYREFSDWLNFQEGYFDNFVGSVFKIVKAVFRYFSKEKYLQIPDYYESFYVRNEVIRIFPLLPHQFYFLIADREFHSKLSLSQRRIKDLFVFGCCAALRFSDLSGMLVRNIENRSNGFFLVYNSQKTDTPVQLKLPAFATEIFIKYSRNKKPMAKLFPRLALGNFNKGLQKLAARAGWNEITGKTRSRNGIREEVKTKENKLFRFCDHMCSHTMRRTGITILLMMGMSEYLVRKISGHSAHSKEFFRYVNLAQSYINDEMDKAYQKLMELYALSDK